MINDGFANKMDDKQNHDLAVLQTVYHFSQENLSEEIKSFLLMQKKTVRKSFLTSYLGHEISNFSWQWGERKLV